MSKYRLYNFDPVNPEKYKGDTIPIIMRSSWEVEFAKTCDLMPTVLSWSYESRQIPYHDPLTGKQKVYIPDFFVEVAQSDGYTKHFVFEIKPMHEQKDEFARNSTDAALIAKNNAKWAAASQWADRHSAEFVILNEADLFSWHDARRQRVHTVKSYTPTYATKVANTKTSTGSRSISKGSKSITTPKKAAAQMKKRIQNARATKVSSVRKIKSV
jgi:hypothetical protein